MRAAFPGWGLALLLATSPATAAPFSAPDMMPGESITYEGAAGRKVQAWIVKPASFDPAQRYPLLVLIHGGPQSVWGDAWTYRWNAQVFAHATEELLFTDWELKGPYWSAPEVYERFSPNRFVKSFKTPTLVIHGERDYRVPVEQALGMFTALQRQGVPSRLLVFPDENHWVLKPASSMRWYREVLGWLDRWTKP